MAMTSVPVKIDTSALAAAISNMQQNQPVEHIAPAEVITAAGERIAALHERFTILNKLAAALEGTKSSDPLPASLAGLKIAITFPVPNSSDGGGTPDTATAEIFNVACIGDLGPLLSTELGVIIHALEQETQSVVAVAERTNAACAKARGVWETRNPDRKIVPTSLVNNAGVPLGVPTPPQVVVNSAAAATETKDATQDV
jgi:hypothetical protein